MIGDLHMHSNNSDGSLDIEELVFISAKTGLDYLSITDHNFMNSSVDLLKLGEKYNIGIINGAEISCFDSVRNRKVHVLCYGSIDQNILRPICDKATKIRVDVGNQKADFAKNRFIVPQKLIDKYMSKTGCIYQQNLVHALMDCGYCNSIYGEFYDSLSSKKLSIESENDFDIKYVLEHIHRAGGKAIMAHPFVYDSFDLLKELIGENLIDGAEVWHPKNSKRESKLILNLIEEHGLIATGGTDFHGFYSSYYLSRIGQFYTPEIYLKRLVN